MLERTIDLDRTFQALADRSRRTMVERVILGAASVSELAEPLAMSLAAVLQHVQVLEACGVVTTEKVGRTRICRIEGRGDERRRQWISDRRRGWEARLDRLGDVLTRSHHGGEAMTPSTVAHDTFVIERPYDASVAQVFRAWSDPSSRPAGLRDRPRRSQPATTSTFGSGAVRHPRWSPGGPVYTYDSRFHDIVPEQRIVSTYEMAADGQPAVGVGGHRRFRD